MMMTKTGFALAVTLAVCVAPNAVARTDHTRTHQVTSSYGYGSAYPNGSGYQWSPRPGYGATLPAYTHGWDCVTDEGQGRFLPCEMGGN